MHEKRDASISKTLMVGIAQMCPVWLNREATLEKVLGFVEAAARADCRLVVFGEALLPGYPFWIERTDGARFDSPVQKDFYAHYLDQAVRIDAGHLGGLCRLAGQLQIGVFLGCVERASDRGGHSLYCSLVYVDSRGEICSVHRKLMPTYEERLVWAIGDGHGLRVHSMGDFTLGGLNCWENWMPLVRCSLYAQGEDLHVAVWPGGIHNTVDITRFIAKEARSYVVSACGLMKKVDIPLKIPHQKLLADNCPKVLANGGSCIAGPDGQWVVEPVLDEEKLIVAALDPVRVATERQNFDCSGHYARPDVTRLVVDRKRQGILIFEKEGAGLEEAEEMLDRCKGTDINGK